METQAQETQAQETQPATAPQPKPKRKPKPKPTQPKERAKSGPKPRRQGVKMVGIYTQLPEALNAEFRAKLAEVGITMQAYFETQVNAFLCTH